MDKPFHCSSFRQLLCNYVRPTLFSVIFFAALLLSASLFAGAEGERRYVFIDGGAHKGETVIDFVNSALYAVRPWEIISFEPNKSVAEQIPALANLQVLNKAIWTSDEGVEFYLAKDSFGSSINKEKQTGSLEKVAMKVESVDFGNWLKQNFKQEDFVLVKLDIEGAEYDVLEKMLQDHAFNYVDRLYVEFHNTKVGVSPKRDQELMERIAALNVPIKANPNTENGDWFQD